MVKLTPSLKKASSGFEYLKDTFLRIHALKFARFKLQSMNLVPRSFDMEKFEKYKSEWEKSV